MKTIKIYLNIILIFLFFGNCQIIAENPVDLDFDFSSLMKSFDGEDFSKFDFDDQEDGEEYDEELLAQEEELLNLFSQQFDQVSLKENADPQENKEVKEEVKQRDEKVDQEFQQHLNKFFPKVFIAREKFFERMTPEQVANAFQEIVDIISDKPWLCLEQLYKQIVRQLNPEQKQKWEAAGHNLDYILDCFRNSDAKKWLKGAGGFWEFVADQLSFYDEFINRAKVGGDGIVFLEKNVWKYASYFPGSFDNADNKKIKKPKKLKDYWDEHGITVHHDFYALCFDYFAKLFLEGILNKDLRHAYRYHDDLRIIMDKLAGTAYESKRQEDTKVYKELLEILKEKNKVEYFSETKNEKYYEEMNEFYDLD